MKVKRLLALVLAGSMLTLSLAGCGSTQKEESGEGAASTGQQQEESKASGDKTVITMMYSGTPSSLILKQRFYRVLWKKNFRILSWK